MSTIHEKEQRILARNTLLIVDDVEMNRVLLAETFRRDFQILEAENGREALAQIDAHKDELAAVLLDLIMPEVDGMEVLKQMHEQDLISSIPVFLITAENSWSVLQHAYELGVMDIIEKPFVTYFIKRRIDNLIKLDRMLKLQATTIDIQTDKIESLNQSLLESMATAVEFRDCESGEHVKRLKNLTFILGKYAAAHFPHFGITMDNVSLIAESSVLHDVGKISIPDAILNKPGRLTKEEFEEMKLHTVKGCEFLETIDALKETELYQYAYDICRWHHERYDGRGYPDGLIGPNIPGWAQVVSLADVYDALVSPRVYKAPFTHEQAVEMILNGECGTFGPEIIESVKACAGEMRALYPED